MLVGFGLAPPPSRINGPLWLAICVGLVFLAGGVMVAVRGWLAVPNSADLPGGCAARADRCAMGRRGRRLRRACRGRHLGRLGDGERQFVLPLPVYGSLGEPSAARLSARRAAHLAVIAAFARAAPNGFSGGS